MRNAPPTRSVPPTAPSAVDAVAAARGVAPAIRARAGVVDAAAAYPADDIADLAAAGLLAAPFAGIAIDALRTVLTLVGAASLTVGRLYEGHVNAIALVRRYGDAAALALLAAEAAAGRPSGVWNAERDGGLVARRDAGGWRLSGRKVHCSGAGSVRRPLVTARVEGSDAPTMFLPDMAGDGVTIDLGVWRAAGMRGTATGTVVFDRLHVPDAAVVGGASDYYRSPWFSGGAWRVLAVQLGGLEQIMALHAARLRASGRDRDPVIRARFARAAGAHEAARLLVAEAALRAEAPGDAEAIDAYVDLARGHFEEVALGVIEATRRNVGLSAFIAPDPLDRTLRDLDTYLRQPFLDASRDHAAGWLLAQLPQCGQPD
jgi:alkylation response protein AidB-like acyl-CoA dehydrogenase